VSKKPKPSARKPATPDTLTAAEVTELKGLGYEAAVARLEQIIDRIESGEVGLEGSLVEYERGVILVARCREILDRAEQKVAALTPTKGSGSRSARDPDEEEGDEAPF